MGWFGDLIGWEPTYSGSCEPNRFYYEIIVTSDNQYIVTMYHDYKMKNMIVPEYIYLGHENSLYELKSFIQSLKDCKDVKITTTNFTKAIWIHNDNIGRRYSDGHEGR